MHLQILISKVPLPITDGDIRTRDHPQGEEVKLTVRFLFSFNLTKTKFKTYHMSNYCINFKLMICRLMAGKTITVTLPD